MSWEQLIDIAREAAHEAADEASRPPLDCPVCGTALEQGPRSTLHCPFDGWVWDGMSGT